MVDKKKGQKVPSTARQGRKAKFADLASSKELTGDEIRLLIGGALNQPGDSGTHASFLSRAITKTGRQNKAMGGAVLG